MNLAAYQKKIPPDSYLHKIIKEGGGAVGKSSSMAPWGSVLSDQEIAQLVALIKGFK